MTVVEASVAVKWFTAEDADDRARYILGGRYELIAPDLIRIEVASALTRKARMGEISIEDASSSLRLWRDMLARERVHLVDSGPDIEAAAQLSLGLKHPLQDCLYLALALRRGEDLLTADKRFFDKALPAHQNLRLL